MSKFTCGKWVVDVIYGDHYVVFPNDRIVADNRIVADCSGSNANARLIANAPKMYRLLGDAAGVISQLNHGDPLVDTIDELLDEIDGKEDTEDE